MGHSMDKTLESFVDFITGTAYQDLPPRVEQKASQILLDTLGCAIGGMDCKAAKISRLLAGTPPKEHQGSVLGSPDACSPDLAAFWNTSMIRYLDFNDHLVAGHPSDMLGALLAVSTLEPISGADLLTSIVISYEVHARLVEALKALHTIDRSYSITVGATAGVSFLLRLSRQQAHHAMSMAITSGLALRAARSGALSDYKGVASAAGTQFAVFATLLAKHGLTGPTAPLAGRHGLSELILGSEEPLELEQFTDWKILATCHKYWPVAYNMQAAIWAAVELHNRLRITEVERITLHTAGFAWFESGSEAEKWNPQTRETADHSLPYAFARALEFGTIDQAAFEPEALKRDVTLELMKKTNVQADPRRGPQISDVVGVTAVVNTGDGRSLDATINLPRGHHANPMTDEELTQKALMLIQPRFGDRTGELIDLTWNAASLKSIKGLMDAFASPAGGEV
jgi:2-methylcitrate dehydratase